MVDSISGNVPTVSGASSPVSAAPIAVKASNPVTTQPAAAPKAPAAADSVEISVSAQVKSLQKQGQNVSEIALQLGMDPQRVALYLGDKA